MESEKHWIVIKADKIIDAYYAIKNIQADCWGFDEYEVRPNYSSFRTNPSSGEFFKKDPAFNRGQDNDVAHPTHYSQTKIEVIEAIEDWGLEYHRGNALKYIARAGKKDKDKEVQDLEKAVWYLKREIECLSAKIENREKIRPNDMGKNEKEK